MEKRSIEQRCRYDTQRLKVSSWMDQVKESEDESMFVERVVKILTSNVTKALPAGWQNVTKTEGAQKWIKERDEESHFLSVQLSATSKIVGFVFLYEYMPGEKYYDLRFGYLLSEDVWGQGLGTELIEGLVSWCKEAGDIRSITGGVETTNIGSIRVMEKAGFTIAEKEIPVEDVVFYEYKFFPNSDQ